MNEPMGYLDALAILEARGESGPGLRAACETSAKRDRFRRLAIRKAGGHVPEPEPEKPPSPAPGPKARPAVPPLRVRAGTLARAVGRWMANGLPLASEEEFNRRRAICFACDLYDAEKDRCAKCGCGLKAKPRLATERCPVGKW